MTSFCKNTNFYVSSFEIQVFVHQWHTSWKDRKVDPIGSALVPPTSLRVIKVSEIRKEEDIPRGFENPNKVHRYL